MLLAHVPPLQRGPCEPTTICVTEDCPSAMMRRHNWCLDDYDLEKQLYRGKASLLYSATCRHSGQRIVLKLYRKHKLSELNWYQVAREIQIHSTLHHEHIIALYGAFEDAKHVYLVQEFAVGGDLYEQLKRNGRLKEHEVASQVLRPALLALRYMHAQGVVHRDIKPENILVTANSIKLADFGLSINADQERPVTRAGTLDYMAPEVLICPEKSRPEDNKEKQLLVYDRHVDSWALGVLAFELIVGRPPFERESRSSTYEAIMYRRPHFPLWISDAAREFITLALVKSAKARPEIIDLLRHQFSGWSESEEGSMTQRSADTSAAMDTDSPTQQQQQHQQAEQPSYATPFANDSLQTTSVSFNSATFLSSSSLSAASMGAAMPAPAQEPSRPHRFDPELVSSQSSPGSRLRLSPANSEEDFGLPADSDTDAAASTLRKAASQDVRNLSRFASDAAAITAQALPSNQRSVMASASSLDSQLPDNEELQARRLAALAGSGSSGFSPAYKASRMGPSRELSSSQSPHQGSGANDSLAAEMACMAVDQQGSPQHPATEGALLHLQAMMSWGSSVKQLAQMYFGAPGAAKEQDPAAGIGSAEGSAEGTYTFRNARGTGPFTGSTAGTFSSQGWCDASSVSVLSAPGCAGVKRGSSFDRTESGPLGRQISGAGPTMEEAVANALRLQADPAVQQLGQPTTPRQRFSPFKRPVRAGQPRPGSARAVLGVTANVAMPGSGTAPPGHREGGVGGSSTPGQRSDVPMQRLLGGKARLRPVVLAAKARQAEAEGSGIDSGSNGGSSVRGSKATATLKRSSAIECSATSVPSLERPAWIRLAPTPTARVTDKADDDQDIRELDGHVAGASSASVFHAALAAARASALALVPDANNAVADGVSTENASTSSSCLLLSYAGGALTPAGSQEPPTDVDNDRDAGMPSPMSTASAGASGDEQRNNAAGDGDEPSAAPQSAQRGGKADAKASAGVPRESGSPPISWVLKAGGGAEG